MLSAPMIPRETIGDYLAVFSLSAAEQALTEALARLSPQVADALHLLAAGLSDVGRAAWRLAQLSAVLQDPAAIAEISQLSELSMAKRNPGTGYTGRVGPALALALNEASAAVRGVFSASERGAASAERILPSLLVLFRDGALIAEAADFITYFLSQHPAVAPDAEAGTVPHPDGLDDFSPAVRVAVSVDLDGDKPFRPPGSVIGPLPLALVTMKEGMTVPELTSDLAAAGYASATHADWDRVADAANRLLWFLAQDGDIDLDDQGRADLADDLGLVAKAIEKSSRSGFQALLAALTAAGLAGEMTERIARSTLPPAAVLEQHATVLVGDFPLGADVVTLARLAALEAITLGEALDLIKGYRPLAEPRWSLPEELPPALASRVLSPAERAFLVDSNVGNDESRSWAELLVQTSVVSGLPLRDIVSGVLPLLTATGVPTDDLRRLSEACPGAITFDDLLILGCLQTWPDFSQEQVKAITRPFCRFPSDLPARVTHWLQHASAWTARSQYRPGRPGADLPSPRVSRARYDLSDPWL